MIRVEWTRRPDGIHYSLTSDKPIRLHRDGGDAEAEAVTGRYEAVFR